MLLPVFLGVLGLVVDNGALHVERRDLQALADAAALVVAHELRRGNASYDSIVRDAASKRGLATADGVDLQVNRPPSRGFFTGDSNYVEVVVRRDTELFFMRALGRHRTLVEARAVAGLRPRKGCIYVLNPTAPSALDVGGTGAIDIDGCTVEVNSSAPDAAVTQGAGTVSADAVRVVGNYSGAGFHPTPETGIAHFEDPLILVPAPPVTGCDHVGTVRVTVDTILHPGTYCGGIAVVRHRATLNPGIYVLRGGGLRVGRQGSVVGNGVTLYNTSASEYPYAPFDIQSDATISLSAPSTGVYRGVLFFNDRAEASDLKNVVNKNGDAQSFYGAFYFPSAPLKFAGGGTVDVSTVLIVADTLEMRGHSRFAGMPESAFPVSGTDARVVE